MITSTFFSTLLPVLSRVTSTDWPFITGDKNPPVKFSFFESTISTPLTSNPDGKTNPIFPSSGIPPTVSLPVDVVNEKRYTAEAPTVSFVASTFIFDKIPCANATLPLMRITNAVINTPRCFLLIRCTSHCCCLKFTELFFQ